MRLSLLKSVDDTFPLFMRLSLLKRVRHVFSYPSLRRTRAMLSADRTDDLYCGTRGWEHCTPALKWCCSNPSSWFRAWRGVPNHTQHTTAAENLIEIGAAEFLTFLIADNGQEGWIGTVSPVSACFAATNLLHLLRLALSPAPATCCKRIHVCVRFAVTYRPNRFWRSY